MCLYPVTAALSGDISLWGDYSTATFFSLAGEGGVWGCYWGRESLLCSENGLIGHKNTRYFEMDQTLS